MDNEICVCGRIRKNHGSGFKPSREALLTKYSAWLETHGYMDSDWWAETPTAVERFLEETE